MGDRVVELNPTLSADYMLVIFKHRKTVDYVKSLKDGAIKLFGKQMTIKPHTEYPVTLTGEYFPVKVKYPEDMDDYSD